MISLSLDSAPLTSCRFQVPSQFGVVVPRNSRSVEEKVVAASQANQPRLEDPQRCFVQADRSRWQVANLGAMIFIFFSTV
jgi:hypothetical protein